MGKRALGKKLGGVQLGGVQPQNAPSVKNLHGKDTLKGYRSKWDVSLLTTSFLSTQLAISAVALGQ